MAASKQASIHMHVHNTVTLVWGSLRLAPIRSLNVKTQMDKMYIIKSLQDGSFTSGECSARNELCHCSCIMLNRSLDTKAQKDITHTRVTKMLSWWEIYFWCSIAQILTEGGPNYSSTSKRRHQYITKNKNWSDWKLHTGHFIRGSGKNTILMKEHFR